MTNTSSEQTEILAALTANTIASLMRARGYSKALFNAVKQFCEAAAAANMDIEDIENILGVNDNCIMDLAGLSEVDEDVVIDAFEEISTTLQK